MCNSMSGRIYSAAFMPLDLSAVVLWSSIIAPPTKPCHQILDIKKISLRQKNLKCGSIPAFFFLDKFPFYFRLFGKG